MLRFISGKFKPVSLDFNVWNHSLPEIYGIILGMFSKLGLIECLGISESELLDFIIDVDRGYLATFYHSFYHAADVTAVLYHMLLEMNASQYLCKPDMAALLLAGLCHDIGHPGLNNLFQVNAKTELAMEYGETSVLEKYSCSLAMDLVAKHKLFRNVASSPAAILPENIRATEESMKESMIKAIMATDMSFHYDMLNNLNTLIEVTSTPSSTPFSSDSETTGTESDADVESTPSSPVRVGCKHSTDTLVNGATSSTSETLHSLRSRYGCPVSQHHHHHRRQFSSSSASSSSSDDSLCSEGSTQTTHSIDVARSPSDLTPELRQTLCNCLLHAADISNPVKPWALCKKWSDLVVQEFFRQGDIEKAQNLPISPNMDREQYNQPQIGLGFGDFVVQPYFESFAEFLPEAAPFLVSLASNREQWVLQKAAMEAEKAACLAQDSISKTATTTTTIADSADAVNVEQDNQPVDSDLLQGHLTTGRRVSVAAGVLVLDDTRPHRSPHHRRLRHLVKTEDGAHHHHAIRKIKRSLSGRALSSYLRDLHLNPRSKQASNKTAMGQGVAASTLKREAALVGKKAETAMSLTDSNTANKTEDIEESRLSHSKPASPQDDESCDNMSQYSHSSPTPITQYRQRRHGSLQLEHKYPSIREEYGDGYVILNHQDTSPGRTWDRSDHDSDDVKFIPLDPLHASRMPGAWPQSNYGFEMSFHDGMPPKSTEQRHQNPQHPHQPPLHALTSRSSTPAVLTGTIHYDWGRRKSGRTGCGPLDDICVCMAPSSTVVTATPLSSISTAAVDSIHSLSHGPLSPALGSAEGPFQSHHQEHKPLAKMESAAMVPAAVSVSSDDGPLGCVVSTSASRDQTETPNRLHYRSGELNPCLFHGQVIHRAASAWS
ncbi:hypothetical protein EDD11_009839 [Mortierella claussenii]|nr:hypothetical protein EDD11_009839 [Mortierella claussenii]